MAVDSIAEGDGSVGAKHLGNILNILLLDEKCFALTSAASVIYLRSSAVHIIGRFVNLPPTVKTVGYYMPQARAYDATTDCGIYTGQLKKDCIFCPASQFFPSKSLYIIEDKALRCFFGGWESCFDLNWRLLTTIFRRGKQERSLYLKIIFSLQNSFDFLL